MEALYVQAWYSGRDQFFFWSHQERELDKQELQKNVQEEPVKLRLVKIRSSWQGILYLQKTFPLPLNSFFFLYKQAKPRQTKI